MTKILHPVAGAVAMLTIATFWLSTALTESFGSYATVTTVKTAIPWGFFVLIPALMVAGGSGFALAKGRPRVGLVGAKARRMPLIAANGILILIPSALFLAAKANAAEFDAAFHTVQTLELTAGAVNLVLLGLNVRDGLRMKGRLRRRPSANTLR